MSTEKPDPNDPSNVSLAYEFMAPKWAKVRAILGGTDGMRAAGPDYLPQHDGESDISYRERLGKSVLFNATELTVNHWVGKPFSEPVKINNDVPENIKDNLLEDIDLQGNNIDVFARNWFKDGVSKAFSHVLVEFSRPRNTEQEEGRRRTLEDDRVENVRPYWVHIQPENLISATMEIQNGKEVLTEIRIMQEVVEKQGFLEVVIPQIRVQTQTQVTLYRPHPTKKKNGKPVWEIFEMTPIDLGVIPLITFYSDRDGFMMGKPPIEDLVDLNIAHWQSMSDQIAVLTVARFPILALSGGDDDESKPLKIGPRQVLFTPDPQGRYYYVEHTGSAIEAGRKHLEDLEDQMSEYGAEFLKQRPGSSTATARALDSAEATSPLQDAVIRFTDAVNQALAITAQWLRIEEGGTVEVNRQFGMDEVSVADLTALKDARQRRDISRARYLDELHRRGVLSDEFDFDENLVELENEASEILGQTSLDIDPGQEDNDDDENNPGGEASNSQG